MISERLTAPLPCPPNWRLAHLKSICTKIGSGATPTGGQAAYQDQRSNYALVRSQNVFDREFSASGLAFISDEQAKGLRNVRLERGDILLNITGDGVTFGRACLVPKHVMPACVNQHVSIVRLDRNLAHPGYVLSYLTHPLIKNYIESFNTGGSRRAITKGHIESFVVPLPPMPVQKSIAETLGALDDRITLLRETNATLEAIAQALFKSWFVDFDPVHARAQGLQPQGMEAATAALFPDSFEESELGLVPKGWRVGSCGDLAKQKKGSVNPQATPNEWFEHFSLPAFDNAQTPVIEQGETIKSNKTPLPQNAVLLSKLNPHIPRVWLPVQYGNNAVCSTEFLAYSPKGSSSKELNYCLFNAPVFQQQLCRLVTGTSNSHQRVKPDQVLLAKIVIATDPLLRAFSDAMKPLFERVYANREQTQSLTQLRDTLLPRLISGQLRLPEAESLLEQDL